MREIAKSFRNTMLKIGIAMIVLLAVFEALSFIWIVIDDVLQETLPVFEATMISQISYAFVYSFSFAVPTVILMLITKKEKTPMAKRVGFHASYLLYIFVAISVGFSFSYLNQMIVGIFGSSGGSAIDSSFYSAYDEPYEIALELLITAILPAIFEELLFRGAVLSRLRKYGKLPAVLISAVLFGLMHQNANQFLYTTMAGIVLAWVAVETESLLPGIILHFFNNFLGVVQVALLANVEINLASTVWVVIELAVFVIGLFSLVWLMLKYYNNKKENDFTQGVFGKRMELAPSAENSIGVGELFKLSLKAPTIIIFAAIAISLGFGVVAFQLFV